MIEGYCILCGKPFRRNRGKLHDKGKYCSPECGFLHRIILGVAIRQERKQKREEELIRTCEICGKQFRGKSKKTRFCSDECKRKYVSDQNKIKGVLLRPLRFVPKIVKCRWCGKEFKTEFKKSKVFCSPECKEAKRKEAERAVSRRNAHNHARRIRNKLVDRDITLDKLIERDKGRCMICGGKIDKKDFTIVNGRMKCGSTYPTIDHIVLPLS